MNDSGKRLEEGFTVAEVAVTLMILSIVMVIMLQFLTHATDVTARTESNSRTEAAAQLALREMTAELRAADPAAVSNCSAPLPTSLNNCLTYEIKRNVSGLNSCPKTRVSVALAGVAPDRTVKVTREEIGTGGTPATCASTPSSTTERVLLKKVVNNLSGTSPENLFTYYGGDGSVLNPASPGFTFRSVDSIRTLLLLEYRNGANRLDFRSVVALRNNNNR